MRRPQELTNPGSPFQVTGGKSVSAHTLEATCLLRPTAMGECL